MLLLYNISIYNICPHIFEHNIQNTKISTIMIKRNTTNKAIAAIIVVFVAFMMGYETLNPLGDIVKHYIGSIFTTILGGGLFILGCAAFVWLIYDPNENVDDTDFE